MKILSFDIGIRYLAFCLVSCKMTPLPPCPWTNFEIEHWEIVDLVEDPHLTTIDDKDKTQNLDETKNGESKESQKNAKTINIHIVSDRLTQILLAKQSLLKGVTHILVEQQPISSFGKNKDFGSIRMKIIQTVIMTFYKTYFLMSPTLINPQIKAASAQNKLKVCIDVHNMCVPPLKASLKNTKYQQRKQQARASCDQIINLCTVDAKMKNYYQRQGKKNDLADCVMQAVYLIQNEGFKLHKVALKEQAKQAKKATKPPISRKRKRVENNEEHVNKDKLTQQNCK